MKYLAFIFITLFWAPSASAQVVPGIPPPSYFAFVLGLGAISNCEQQFPKSHASVDRFISELQSAAPGMLNSDLVKEFKAKSLARANPALSPQAGLTLDICNRFAEDKSSIKRIASLYLEEKAESENRAFSDARWMYWLDHPKHHVPCLGISFQDEPSQQKYARIWAGKPRDFIVTEVQANSPASSVELRVGDKVQAINNRNLARESDLMAIVYAMEPGETYSLRAERDGQIRELMIKTGARRLSMPLDFECREFAIGKEDAQQLAPEGAPRAAHP